MSYFGKTVRERSFAGYRLLEKEHRAGEAIGHHEHAQPYLALVLAGAYSEKGALGELELSAGSAIFHPPGDRHEDAFLIGSRLLVLEVPKRFSSEAATGDGWVSRGFESARIGSALARELRSPDEFTEMILDAAILELSALGGRSRTREKASSDTLTRAAERYIDEHFFEPVSLRSLAEHFGVDPSHLARVFRSGTGFSIGERLRHRRVEYVMERLSSRDELCEIAIDAGFADQSHMTRTFRSLLGTTPGEWRRTHRC